MIVENMILNQNILKVCKRSATSNLHQTNFILFASHCQLVCNLSTSGPSVIKLFSCSSQPSINFQLLTFSRKKMLALKLSNVVLILLINVKMSTNVDILTFMSSINVMLT